MLLLFQLNLDGGGIEELSGASASITWVVPLGTLSSVKELSGTSAVSTWVVPVGSLTVIKELTGASAVITWVVPLGTFGSLGILVGSPAVSTWVVPLGTLSIIKDLVGSAPSITWVVPVGVIDVIKSLTGSSAVITWVVPTGSLYAPGDQNEALYQLYNLTCRLNVKQEIDSGNVLADSGDAGGTAVGFNKAFKDVDSVTATALGTTELKVTVDFTDVPNPTGFNIFVFDSAGARADATVYWKARGVV